MISSQFCFWLQGFFELSAPGPITEEQAEIIKTHLALVFQHDPTMEHKTPKPLDETLNNILKDKPNNFRPTLLC